MTIRFTSSPVPGKSLSGAAPETAHSAGGFQELPASDDAENGTSFLGSKSLLSLCGGGEERALRSEVDGEQVGEHDKENVSRSRGTVLVRSAAPRVPFANVTSSSSAPEELSHVRSLGASVFVVVRDVCGFEYLPDERGEEIASLKKQLDQALRGWKLSAAECSNVKESAEEAWDEVSNAEEWDWILMPQWADGEIRRCKVLQERKRILSQYKKRTERAEKKLYDYITAQINRNDIAGEMNFVREQYINSSAGSYRRSRSPTS